MVHKATPEMIQKQWKDFFFYSANKSNIHFLNTEYIFLQITTWQVNHYDIVF
jgi:hypothetical protein